MPAQQASFDPDTTVALIHEVLRTGINLAKASRESTDADAADFALNAARRLYLTAQSIIGREPESAQVIELQEELDRLSEILRPARYAGASGLAE